MRTNIDIDDRLMRQAMRISGARTKKGAVEAALRLLTQIYDQGASGTFVASSDGKATLKNPARAEIRRKPYPYGDRRHDSLDRLFPKHQQSGNELVG